MPKPKELPPKEVAPQPLPISQQKIAMVRVVKGVLIRQRSVSLMRFESGNGSETRGFSGDAGGFDLSMAPMGIVVRDLKKPGRAHLVPWVNVEDVEFEDEA